MKNTVQNLKGFRDILPPEKRARDFVAAKLKEVFELYGFEPLETPTLEYASLLTGKYGDEADKLLYLFEDRGGRQIGLRYDQTVPTTRVLAQYQNELPKFFRRYQMQNVFRADKPQAGRYREFTQCDIDIFGSTSPLADAEILACTYSAVKNIGFEQVIIRINDRQTLISQLSTFASKELSVFSIIQSVDKLDKLTKEEVVKELEAKGLAPAKAKNLLAKLDACQMTDSLKEIVDLTTNLGVPAETLVFSPTLARGLDYYTGLIFEVIIPDYASGSCGGGGRYDNLVEQIAGYQMPAVGVGLGFDRLVEAAVALKLIPKGQTGTQILVALFDNSTIKDSLKLADKLRQSDLRVEVFPNIDKLGKQFKLADQKKIPVVALIGEQEMKNSQITLKNMISGEQKLVESTQVVAKVKQMLGI